VNLPERTDHRDSLTLSAVVSDIDINWIDGVHGEAVLKKVIPEGGAADSLSIGNRGSWRAHLNAVRA
jgi:hypothetical protein